MQTRRLGFLRVPTAAFVVALGLATGAAAAPGSSHASKSDVAAPAVRIENFGQVSSVLYRGSQPQGRDYADLKTLGVKTIVNLTSDDADPNERSMAEAAGIAYVQIPMTVHTPPTSPQLAQFLALVSDPASQPVYVHCVGGRHRYWCDDGGVPNGGRRLERGPGVQGNEAVQLRSEFPAPGVQGLRLHLPSASRGGAGGDDPGGFLAVALRRVCGGLTAGEVVVDGRRDHQ